MNQTVKILIAYKIHESRQPDREDTNKFSAPNNEKDCSMIEYHYC